MSEQLVVEHCAPTLTGIKTGNLFSCALVSKERLIPAVRAINRKLVPKGIRVLPLRCSEKRALIYVYRPAALARDFENPAAAELLVQAGYRGGTAQSVARLAKKLRSCDDFPHEIGLFLSYPPEDVRGFILHKGANYKCVGCWKVYGDEEKARETFSRYKRCTSACCLKWSGGIDIEELAAAM